MMLTRILNGAQRTSLMRQKLRETPLERVIKLMPAVTEVVSPLQSEHEVRRAQTSFSLYAPQDHHCKRPVNSQQQSVHIGKNKNPSEQKVTLFNLDNLTEFGSEVRSP